MSESVRVTDESAFSKGSLGIQIVLTVVTFGLYTLYWTYSTAKQLDAGTDEDLTPIFGVLPVLNLIAFWQISEASEAVTDQSNIVLFLLFVFFAPVSWYLVQSGINDVAVT